MNPRRACLIAASALWLPQRAQAQPAAALRRVGLLGNPRPEDRIDPMQQIFVAAMAELGWREGRTIAFEYRGAEPRYERLQELVRELVRLDVELLVVSAGVTAALAAKEVTTTIPILAVGVADPVKFGLVSSLAHPGGNVTGIAGPVAEWGKYLELAHEAVPTATRVAVFANSTSVVYADYVAQNEAAARQLGLKLQMIPVAQRSDLAPAFEAMKREHAQALVVGSDRVFLTHLTDILDAARANRLPVIASVRAASEAGALVSYGLDGRALVRQAASYADRLLRGAKPADLPFEQPSRFELIVNRRSARSLGLALSPSLLARADEIIE